MATRILGAQSTSSKYGIPAGLGLLSPVVAYRPAKPVTPTEYSPFTRQLAKMDLTIGESHIALSASYGGTDPELRRFTIDETRPYAVVEGRPLFLSKTDLDALVEFCEFETDPTGQALVLTNAGGDGLARYYDAEGNKLQEMRKLEEVAIQTWYAKSRPLPAVQSIKFTQLGGKVENIRAVEESHWAVVVHSRHVKVSQEDLNKLKVACGFDLERKPKYLSIHTYGENVAVATCSCFYTSSGKNEHQYREARTITNLGVELEL